jgi:hypothetical protein
MSGRSMPNRATGLPSSPAHTLSSPVSRTDQLATLFAWLTAFVHGAGGLRCQVAGDAAGGEKIA